MKPEPPVRYREPGARWRSVAYGPVFCAVILVIEISFGAPVHWFGLIAFAALLAGFVALQVVAGKKHVSVELTDTTLRQGTEVISLADIAYLYPEADDYRRREEPWEEARALGELSDVPRGRTAIGVKLRGDIMVRAWARNDERLREHLTSALERLRKESS